MAGGTVTNLVSWRDEVRVAVQAPQRAYTVHKARSQRHGRVHVSARQHCWSCCINKSTQRLCHTVFAVLTPCLPLRLTELCQLHVELLFLQDTQQSPSTGPTPSCLLLCMSVCCLHTPLALVSLVRTSCRCGLAQPRDQAHAASRMCRTLLCQRWCLW